MKKLDFTNLGSGSAYKEPFLMTLQTRVDTFNGREGKDNTGIDCPFCKNRGEIAYIGETGKAALQTKLATPPREVWRFMLARPGGKFCVSVFRQNQEYHIINVHDWGLFPLVTTFPGGWDGMRAGTA